MIRLATNDIVFGCLWAGPCCNHVWCPINGEFPLRHPIAILMGSASSQHRIWPIFWWQHVAKNSARHFLAVTASTSKDMVFLGGCSQRRHLTQANSRPFPRGRIFWALRINAAEMPQCKISFTSRWWKNVLQKFLHSSGSPKKRHLRSTWQ